MSECECATDRDRQTAVRLDLILDKLGKIAFIITYLNSDWSRLPNHELTMQEHRLWFAADAQQTLLPDVPGGRRHGQRI